MVAHVFFLILASAAALVLARNEDPVQAFHTSQIVGWEPSNLPAQRRGHVTSYGIGPDAPTRDVANPGIPPTGVWMSGIPDERSLANISIPGTHMSMSWGANIPESLRHQNYDFGHQLRAGIRYFDLTFWYQAPTKKGSTIGQLYTPNFYGIRADDKGIRKTWLLIYPASMSVIGGLANWLDQHRTETLIIRIRKDPRDTMSTNKEFGDAFHWIMWPFGAGIAAHSLRRRLYIRTKGPGINEVPTMGQLRGKILFLLDFDDAQYMSEYGISWNSTLLHRNKHEDVSEGDVERKWLAVNKQVDKANTRRDGGLWITHAASVEKSKIIPEVMAAGGHRALSDSGMTPRKCKKSPSIVSAFFRFFCVRDRNLKELEDQVEPPKSGKLKNKGLAPVRDKAHHPKGIIGINDRLFKKLRGLWEGTSGNQQVGIVAMDFPGINLVQGIIRLNFPHLHQPV